MRLRFRHFDRTEFGQLQYRRAFEAHSVRAVRSPSGSGDGRRHDQYRHRRSAFFLRTRAARFALHPAGDIAAAPRGKSRKNRNILHRAAPLGCGKKSASGSLYARSISREVFRFTVRSRQRRYAYIVSLRLYRPVQ